jgi:hypothetical protein
LPAAWAWPAVIETTAADTASAMALNEIRMGTAPGCRPVGCDRHRARHVVLGQGHRRPLGTPDRARRVP